MQDTPPSANVLLVDDQPGNLVALRAILEPLGQNLVEARSGREALRCLLEHDFAVILLDVQMPEMDGLETAILIKQREKTRHIPIIFLTAQHKDDLDVFKGYSVGAVNYLFKPLNVEVLRSKVATFIELHRKNEKIRQQAELLSAIREREVEDMRRASEQRYRKLADSMPQIVWTATSGGLLLYRNRRWYECAGRGGESEEALGWDAVLHPEDLPVFEARWEKAVETGEDWEGEFRFGSGGAYRWHLVRALAERDARGNGIWIGTSTDVDDQKRATEASLAANRAKDEFLAVLSHELRTPLNSILGWANLLRRGELDASKRDRALETIERNARVQAELITDLLDVSRIVSGKLSVALAPVSVRGVVEQAVEAARPSAVASRVRLETAYGAGPDEVNGDPDRLQQVVGNLLSNAIKFTPPGGTVRVSLDLERGGEDARGIRIVVEDDGKGIDPAFLPHVFERFRQAGDATTRAQGGLGLGLAIVKHLVEAHGGGVRAESAGAGEGSRFTVTLPRLEDGSRTLRRSGEQLSAMVGADAEALCGVSVLLVEDDPDGRALLELLLSDFGASVSAVASADAAMEALRRGSFDIFLSDIGLPNEDGYSLLKRARATSEGKSVPAIALTAYASREDRARAIAAGFDAHIAKPVVPQALVAAVGALARRSLVAAPA